MTCPRLFVYGTLRKAAPSSQWSRFLESTSSFLGNAHVEGRLRPVGEHTGLVPGGDQTVAGEVHELHNPKLMLATLDDYEGCGANDPPPHAYHRRIIRVTMDDGTSTDAWVYAVS
jgi:gamma-glutamylcyclotransferase (GGCT)/AIG2-like uncharacterized protein YtfP